MPRGGRREKAGRKSGWSNTETQLIRVPKVLADRLLEIAKHLDRGDEFHLVERQIEPEPATPLGIMEPKTPVEQLNIFPIEQADELEPPPQTLPQNDRDELEPPPQSLTGRALSRRLKVSSGTLARYKDTTAKTLKWMLAHDGKWGWFYSSRTELFHPVDFSEFDHLLSELSSDENYENF